MSTKTCESKDKSFLMSDIKVSETKRRKDMSLVIA